jgi:molecular chaperone DnaK
MGRNPPVLRQPIGIQTAGGRFTALLPSGTFLPTRCSFTFTTADAGQASIKVTALQGSHVQAVHNKRLGVFEVSGFPLGPPGAPQIEITFHVDASGALKVTAVDLDTKAELAVSRT